MASAVAEPPVRLVKMIGDAAMLVSTEPSAMLDAALRLVEAAEAEGEEFPFLRAGIAFGRRSPSRATTTAARSTWPAASPAIARPGSVLVDEATKEAAGDGFDYSFAGERRLKGFDSRAKLYRARRERERPPRAEGWNRLAAAL